MVIFAVEIKAKSLFFLSGHKQNRPVNLRRILPQFESKMMKNRENKKARTVFQSVRAFSKEA